MPRFHQAFNRHDAEALVDLVAEDCVIADITPTPDGRVHRG